MIEGQKTDTLHFKLRRYINVITLHYPIGGGGWVGSGTCHNRVGNFIIEMLESINSA